MKAWWRGLQARERQLIVVATVVVVLFVGYTVIWSPLQKNTQRLTRQVESQQQQLVLMKQMAAKIKVLSQRNATATPRASSSSLTALIYQTGQSRLRGAELKRVEEGQNNSVRVWIEKAAFDDLVLWLDALYRSQGLSVDSFVADNQPEAGRVNVRLTLKAS